MKTGSAAADLVASNGLIKFLRREATLSPRKALTVAAVAGLTNAMILAIINTAAEHAEQSESRPLYAIFFAAAMLLYVVAQRWILGAHAHRQSSAALRAARCRTAWPGGDL